VWPFIRSFNQLLASLSTRQRAGEVLRIGRHTVQRWSVENDQRLGRSNITALSLTASTDFPADTWRSNSLPTDALSVALAKLYPTPPKYGIEIVLESAWLPLMLVETGGVLVSEAQAIALLRHRFARLYDSPNDPVASWDVRAHFKAGDALALGYGLSPQVRGGLTTAANALSLKISAIASAWDWGWQRAQLANMLPAQSGWWGWQEQNLWMLGRIDVENSTPQLKSLHPCLAWRDTPQALAQTVLTEARRLGIDQVPEDILIGGWAPVSCHGSAQVGKLSLTCVSMSASGGGASMPQKAASGGKHLISAP
jgi:hypothetical protein